MSTQTMSRNFARSAGSLNPRTPKQVEFIQDLLTQIATYDRERGRALWIELRDLDRAGKLSFAKASETIDALKAERTEHRLGQQTDPREDRPAQRRPEVPEGRYAVNTDEGHLGFYRVRVSDKGFITVTVYASSTEHELPWKAQLGVLRKIEAFGAKEAAIVFGKERKVCGVCGRALTNEESRTKGIGPICEAGF